MADIYGTTSNEYIQSCISWSYTSSEENNESTITAELWYRRTNTGFTTGGTGSFSLTIDGNTKTESKSVSIGTAWVKVMSHTVTVDHDDDGKKTVTLSAAGKIPNTTLSATYCSGTATLTTIARASVPTVSASSVVMLNSVKITTNRKSSSFTHDLTYSFGGSTGTIATGVEESYNWTVPDLVSKIPNKGSDTCTITCKTKNGTTVIGTKTVTLTLTIPTQSSLTASDVQMGKSMTIKMTRNSSAFTHTLIYTIGSTTGSIGTAVGTSYTWTPPKSLAWYTGGNTSATCTITCTTYNGTYSVGTVSTSITLTVPDATVPTLSATSINWGDRVTINMPRETDAYMHELSYTLKAKGSDTVVASGVFATVDGTSASWNDGPQYAMMIPSATEGIFTITCTTKLSYGQKAVVGSKTVSYTEKVPNNEATRPKMTGMTLSPVPVSGLPTKFANLYISGKTSVKASYTAYSDYSYVESYSTTVNGSTVTGNPYISSVLRNTGNVTITGKVTDERGYSTSATRTISVIDYSAPRIIPASGYSNIVCKRCNSDGTPDPGGVYLLIRIGRKYSEVKSGGTQYNYCKLSYQWKKDGLDDSKYSTPVELLAKTANTNYVSVVLSNIVSSNTTAYAIRLIAEDDVGESEVVTITVPTLFTTWHSPAGGHGFTLGGYHDSSKYDVFECWFDAEFHGEVRGIYELGETDGWHWVKFSDGLAQCWRIVNQRLECTSAWGSLFFARCLDVTYPITFVEAPVCSITLEHEHSETISAWLAGNGSATTTKPASVIAVSPVSGTVSGAVLYHTIGRWK